MVLEWLHMVTVWLSSCPRSCEATKTEMRGGTVCIAVITGTLDIPPKNCVALHDSLVVWEMFGASCFNDNYLMSVALWSNDAERGFRIWNKDE